MYVVVIGPHSNTNPQNNFICPKQMKGFMDGIQILQAIYGQIIPIRFYDPCFTIESKNALEIMYMESGMHLEVMIQVFSETDKVEYFRMNNPVLIISFIGSFYLKIKENNITYIPCSCDHGRELSIVYSWADILPEFITNINDRIDYMIPWPKLEEMTVFELSEFYERSRIQPWFEIVKFQIDYLLSSKKYLIFDDNTPEFIFQWCHQNPRFILTNNLSLIDFYHYLIDKNFNFDDRDRNILINSWSNYRREYNINF